MTSASVIFFSAQNASVTSYALIPLPWRISDEYIVSLLGTPMDPVWKRFGVRCGVSGGGGTVATLFRGKAEVLVCPQGAPREAAQDTARSALQGIAKYLRGAP